MGEATQGQGELIELLKGERKRLEGEERDLQGRLAAVRQELRALTTLIDLRESSQPDFPDGRRNGIYSDRACEGGLSSARVEVQVEDIRDCDTQREALYVIAHKSGGIVDANEAGDLIIAAGKSKGQRSTVISTAHRYMSTNPDFEKIGPSKFQLVVGHEIENADGPDEALQGDVDGVTDS